MEERWLSFSVDFFLFVLNFCHICFQNKLFFYLVAEKMLRREKFMAVLSFSFFGNILFVLCLVAEKEWKKSWVGFFFLFLLFIVCVWERKHRVCTFNACLDSVTWICFVSFDLFYVINFGTAIVVLMHPHLIKWSLPLWTLHLLRC